MSRKHYDEIKEKFGVFVGTWKSREVNLLDGIIDKEVICHVSTSKSYAIGAQHSLFGVKNFVLDIPESEVFHHKIFNFTCRISGDEAHQYAYVVCLAAVFQENREEALSFEFTAMLSNHWVKKETGWYITEIRMDILGHGGDLPSFTEAWYFESQKPSYYYYGKHERCINGELDSPWNRIPVAEDNELSEEEMIMDIYAKYAYGNDQFAWDHVCDILTEDTMFATAPWGPCDKRQRLEAIKLHRQKEHMWAHPVKPESIVIDGNKAYVKLFRMSGHRQRNHPYRFTRENIDIEHACSRMDVEFRKEEGIWKICKWNGYLGIVEIGPCSEDVYGETGV